MVPRGPFGPDQRRGPAGLFDVTTGLLLCAAVSAIGVVLFARITADLPADVRETVPEGAARAPRRTLAPTG